MSWYYEPPDPPEFTETHAEQYAEKIADLLDDRDWDATHDAVMKAWHEGSDRLLFPVPDHLQPVNWEIPEDDPYAPYTDAMHEAGL